MHKDKWKTVRDIIIGNCKIVFPVLVIILGAVTAVIALNANRAEAQTPADGQPSVQNESSVGSPADVTESQPEESRPSAKEVPLVANEDGAVYTLVATYYNAIGTGDSDTLQAICRGISENNLIYYGELANYIESYSDIEIYSKQGPADGTAIVYVYYKMNLIDHGAFPGYEALYVCTDEDGSLYIRDDSTFTNEEKEYIGDANEQVDVVEFNNRVIAEYNELMEQNPTLLEYVGMLGEQVNTRVGEILSSRLQGEEAQDPEGGELTAEGGEQPPAEQVPEETGPKYASATTTVNVRGSDSEKADKLGKVSQGTRLEVQEIRLNGWTKVVYEGKDGYIKSDYLQFEENIANLEVIGTVTATTTVRIRAAASLDANVMGTLAEGSSLELLSNENGWCKVNYNNQVAYIKSDFVTQQ
ncbi:MAG: SH3 domain-containing protein [Firmicutes bacterium]|nr:SH3 domain-containing protein [Bacillota bacterium]